MLCCDLSTHTIVWFLPWLNDLNHLYTKVACTSDSWLDFKAWPYREGWWRGHPHSLPTISLIILHKCKAISWRAWREIETCSTHSLSLQSPPQLFTNIHVQQFYRYALLVTKLFHSQWQTAAWLCSSKNIHTLYQHWAWQFYRMLNHFFGAQMEEEDIEPVQVLGQTLPNQCSGWQFCGMLGCFLEELKMPCLTRSWSLYDLHQHLAWWFHRYIHPFTKLKHSWWLTDCLTVGLFPYTLCSLLAFRLTMHGILHCFLEGLKILNLFAMRYQSLHYLYSSLQTFRSMTLHVCSLIY